MPQSDQRPPGRAVEENAKRGTPHVHPAGQGARRRAEEAQPRLLEAQKNQLCKATPMLTAPPTAWLDLRLIHLLWFYFIFFPPQQGCQGNQS